MHTGLPNKLVLIFISGLLFCCSTLPEKKAMSMPNPTRFMFNSSEETIRNSIMSELGDLKYRQMMLCHKWNRLRPQDTVSGLSPVDDKNDVSR